MNRVSNQLLNKRRIYVVSSPRSGSTWLGNTLAANPAVLGSHEPDIVYRGSLPHLITEQPSQDQIGEAKRYMDALVLQRAARTVSRPKRGRKAFRSAIANAVWHPLAFGLKAASTMTDKLGVALNIPLVISDYDQLDAIVIKSVSILGRSPLLTAALRPEDRVIHIIRNPYAVIASALTGAKLNKMAPPKAFHDWDQLPLAIKNGWTLDQMRSRSPAEIAAIGWAGFNDVALKAFEASDQALTVHHEKLVAAEPQTIAALKKHTALDVDITPAKEQAGDGASRYYSLEKDRETVLHGWQKSLSSDQVTAINNVITGTRSASLYGIA